MTCLLWHAEWGRWQSKLKAAGRGKTSPHLYADLKFIWDAFWALSESRVGLEPIKFSEIESWLDLNFINNLERRQEVAHLVRFMDSQLINFVREKNAKS